MAKQAPPKPQLNPAVRALALTVAASKHSQRCPVWETKSPIEWCNCWIVKNAAADVAIVRPVIAAETAEQVARICDDLAVQARADGQDGTEAAYVTAAELARSHAPEQRDYPELTCARCGGVYVAGLLHESCPPRRSYRPAAIARSHTPADGGA